MHKLAWSIQPEPRSQAQVSAPSTCASCTLIQNLLTRPAPGNQIRNPAHHLPNVICLLPERGATAERLPPLSSPSSDMPYGPLTGGAEPAAGGGGTALKDSLLPAVAPLPRPRPLPPPRPSFRPPPPRPRPALDPAEQAGNMAIRRQPSACKMLFGPLPNVHCDAGPVQRRRQDLPQKTSGIQKVQESKSPRSETLHSVQTSTCRHAQVQARGGSASSRQVYADGAELLLHLCSVAAGVRALELPARLPAVLLCENSTSHVSGFCLAAALMCSLERMATSF